MKKLRLDPGLFALPMPVAPIGIAVDEIPSFMPAAFVGIVHHDPAGGRTREACSRPSPACSNTRR